MALLYPNTFQTHNFYVDNCLHLLEGNEWKVLTYAIRRIVGFGKTTDHISLGQFENGLTSRDGIQLDHGTGLHRSSVTKALQSLTSFGFLVEHIDKKSLKLGKKYSLQFDTNKINFFALQARYEQKAQLSGQQAATRRLRGVYEKQSLAIKNHQNNHEVVYGVDPKQSTPKTSSSLRGRPEVVYAVDPQNQGKPSRNSEETQLSVPGTEKEIPLTEKSLPKQQVPGVTQKTTNPTKTKTSVANSNTTLRGAVSEIFTFWQTTMKHPNAILTPKREKVIAGRLKDGYSIEQIKQAIQGCASSDYHMGKKAGTDGTVYDDIELICRDGGKLESFIARYERNQSSPQSTEGYIEHPPEKIKVLDYGIREVAIENGRPFYMTSFGAGSPDYNFLIGVVKYRDKIKELEAACQPQNKQ